MEELYEITGRRIETYEEAEGFLYALPKFTTKNDLSHTGELLQRMGNPGREIIKIHVAGTNGKGSVCAYLQSLLEEYGYKTGEIGRAHV